MSDKKQYLKKYFLTKKEKDPDWYEKRKQQQRDKYLSDKEEADKQ